MSTTFRATALAFVGLATALCIHPALAQSNAHLELTAKLAEEVVALQQEVSLLVVLRNPGPQRVVLRGDPGFSSAGGLVVTATDEAGQRSVLASSPGFINVEEARSGNSKVLLAPDEGLGLGHRFLASDLFSRPGVYSLVVEYESPRPSEGNQSVTPGESEGSRAVSDALTIEVLE